MDLLTGYGSDSDDEQHAQPVPSASAPVVKSAATHGSAPPGAAAVVLPNPFLDGAEQASLTQGPPASAAKRPFTSVTGHSLPAAASKAKSSKEMARAAPGAKPAAVLLPPQLRGRSNVVTEDIDKLFTRRSGSSSKPSAP